MKKNKSCIPFAIRKATRTAYVGCPRINAYVAHWGGISKKVALMKAIGAKRNKDFTYSLSID